MHIPSFGPRTAPQCQQNGRRKATGLWTVTTDVLQDLKEELVAAIQRTCGLLPGLPAGSEEYPLVQEILVRQQITLAVLCLDGRDRWGLTDALRDLAGTAGDPGGRLILACRDIDTLKINEGGLSQGIRDRVRGLLREAEERAGQRPGNR